MAGDGRLAGCFKYGCLGCAVLAAIPVVLVIVLGGIGLVLRQEAEPREESFSHEIAAAPTTPGTGIETPRDPSPTTPATPPDGTGEGTVEFDVRMAEFRIEPGAPGAPLRVEADYDAARFELVESYDARPDGGFDYRLRFGLRRSLAWSLFGNSNNRVRLIVPPDVPIRLSGDVRMGAGVMEFGGLWLRDVDLRFRMGGADIDFAEPLHEPAERFAVEGRMGGGRIRRLGNASPRLATFLQRMGGFEIDLGGAWKNDGELRVDAGMGGLNVAAPDSANLEVGERSVSMGEIRVRRLREPDPSLPTVTVHARGSMGGVDIR